MQPGHPNTPMYDDLFISSNQWLSVKFLTEILVKRQIIINSWIMILGDWPISWHYLSY